MLLPYIGLRFGGGPFPHEVWEGRRCFHGDRVCYAETGSQALSSHYLNGDHISFGGNGQKLLVLAEVLNGPTLLSSLKAWIILKRPLGRYSNNICRKAPRYLFIIVLHSNRLASFRVEKFVSK